MMKSVFLRNNDGLNPLDMDSGTNFEIDFDEFVKQHFGLDDDAIIKEHVMK